MSCIYLLVLHTLLFSLAPLVLSSTLPLPPAYNNTLANPPKPGSIPPGEHPRAVSCLVPSPYILSTYYCSLAIDSMSRDPTFYNPQIFTPSPHAFRGPQLTPDFLPYTWNSWKLPRRGEPVKACSVTLTFMDWRASMSDMWDGGTLEGVQWAAMRIVNECGERNGRAGSMTVGLTRAGVNGKLLVIVGKGDGIPKIPSLNLGTENGTDVEGAVRTS